MLSESRIRLTYGTPRAEPDYISLNALSPGGSVIDSWTVDDPEDDPDNPRIEELDPDGDWRLLKELFTEVHRRVTGWDKVLSDIEKALASPGPIGVPPK